MEDENQRTGDRGQRTEKPFDHDAALAAAVSLLKEHPGGFSVAPDGTLTADRAAIEVKSIEQFSELAREPKTITFDLHGGKLIKFKIRPLNCDEQKEIDDLDVEAPLPPKKQKPANPSLARGRQQDAGADEYDYADKEFIRKRLQHMALRQAAVISRGLLSMEVPGETIEQKAGHLRKAFPPRILDGIENAIRAVTSDPIERALFT